MGLYVSYGSNMNLEQMAYRCPNSRVVGNGCLFGWKLVFNIHADIIQTGKESDYVPVVVWDIDRRDWDMLDRYEGCPYYYKRIIVPVTYDNGEQHKAIVYVMQRNRKGICPPYEDYYQCILQGCADNGIDDSHIREAAAFAIFNETPYNQYTGTRKDRRDAM